MARLIILLVFFSVNVITCQKIYLSHIYCIFAEKFFLN